MYFSKTEQSCAVLPNKGAADGSCCDSVLALDYDRNVIRRMRVTRAYEQHRDSTSPILHDRRE